MTNNVSIIFIVIMSEFCMNRLSYIFLVIMLYIDFSCVNHVLPLNRHKLLELKYVVTILSLNYFIIIFQQLFLLVRCDIINKNSGPSLFVVILDCSY